MNREAVLAQSPGLARSAYPGKAADGDFNPEGVVVARVRRNPFGVELNLGLIPRVAASPQPWALGRNPFGVFGEA
jgi:hypothetical protein